MSKTLSIAEINHLRRLLGWVRCEVGQSSEELIDTAKAIAPAIGEISAEGRQIMIESAEKADSVPKYVRQAIQALEKAIAGQPGEVVDADLSAQADAPRVLAAMAREAGDPRSIEELENFYRSKQNDSPLVQAFQQVLAEEAASTTGKVE